MKMDRAISKWTETNSIWQNGIGMDQNVLVINRNRIEKEQNDVEINKLLI